MEKSNLNFYKQSGDAPIINLIFSILLSSIIIFFLSYYYSLVITYFPLVYFNFLLVCLYGYTIFLTGNSMNRLFKIRNRKRALLSIIIMSFLGVYFQWVCFVYIISSEKLGIFINDWDYFFTILSSPIETLNYIFEINKEGLWEMFSFQVKGALLWLVWFAELALIILMSVVSFLKSKIEPFSNESNNWYVKNTIEKDFENIVLRQKFIAEFSEKPFETISNLEHSRGDRYAKIYIYTSKGARSLIAIDNVIVTERGKGNKDFTSIIEPCYIDSNVVNKLKEKYRIRKPHFFEFITELYT